MSHDDHQHEHDAATPEEADVDRVRLDRRTAMRAAIGGATAAAVWSAPRIEGFSIAPDFAQAASCTSGNANVTNNTNNCGYYGDTECFGNNCCGNKGYNVTVSGSSGINVSGNIGGDVSGDNGRVNIAVNGIDPPFRNCNVNVSGNCNNGNFRTDASNSNNTSINFAFNNNGNATTLIDCQGGGSFLNADTDATVRINVACVCL